LGQQVIDAARIIPHFSSGTATNIVAINQTVPRVWSFRRSTEFRHDIRCGNRRPSLVLVCALAGTAVAR
jgi:hypothetical protein